MSKRSNVKTSLICALRQKGADTDQFLNLVDDYMALWDIKNKLAADVRKRGIVYKDVSATGVPMQKNNPSVKELVNVNRQMLAILKELGITADKCGGDDGDNVL